MDVALDANEFLSDPRMQSVRFQTLLAYLRKTQSRLLIPKLVFDEVIARYPERLSEPHKRASNDMKVLRSLLLAAKLPTIPELKLEKEVAAMKRKLKKPSPYVQALILRNFADVSVEEIARRGIERIPPASSKGEELRDVVIWLMVLGYARKSGGEVAFISSDEHFREDGQLHPRLRHDLESGKIKVNYYRAIDDFIKSHAPSPRTLTEEQVYELCSMQLVLDLFEVEARRFFPRLWGAATKTEITHRKLQFVHAALYDVGGGSQYGEVEFLGRLQVTLSRMEYALPFTWVGNDPNVPSVQQGGVASTFLGSALPSNWAKGDWNVNAQLVDFPTTFAVAAPAEFQNISINYQACEPQSYPGLSFKRSEAVFSGRIAISFRVVANRITKVEVEGFEITNTPTGVLGISTSASR